jgi:hypothetical protein
MSDVEAGLERVVEQSKKVVEQIRDEGREVPEWASTQVKLAEDVLATHRRGQDHRYALNELLRHEALTQSKRDAFFAE